MKTVNKKAQIIKMIQEALEAIKNEDIQIQIKFKMEEAGYGEYANVVIARIEMIAHSLIRLDILQKEFKDKRITENDFLKFRKDIVEYMKVMILEVFAFPKNCEIFDFCGINSSAIKLFSTII